MIAGRVALAPVDLLTRIVTAWPADLGGLDALAVNDRGREAGVAPDPFAICHHERVVYPLKAPVIAPCAGPRRGLARGSPSGAADLAHALPGVIQGADER